MKNRINQGILAVRQQSSKLKTVGVLLGLLAYAGAAHAAFNLPGGAFFCDLASALRSQWAPGVFMLILVFEGIMYYFSPKGAMSKIFIFVVSAGVVFGAATYLGYVGVPQSCGATGIL